MIGGPLSFVKRLLSAYQYPKSPCFCPRDALALRSGDQVGYRLQTPAGHVALQIMIALPAQRGGECRALFWAQQLLLHLIPIARSAFAPPSHPCDRRL